MTTAISSSSICTLDIGGMTCASCVRHVEKALSRIPGVRNAEVNLATEAATVSFDPQTAGLSELTAAVAAAGYTGDIEVEIFNETVWSAPPDETAARLRETFPLAF